MRSPRVELWTACAALLALAACSKEPINLTQGFTPVEASWTAPHHKKDAPDESICRVYIGAVVDKRANPEMGFLGLRVVHDADPAAWLRSGLQTLTRDKRIVIADTAADSDLDLDVDILKAYVINLTTDKSANVVVRVHYSRGGVALGDQVFRGVETGWNWANGTDETQSAFDDALDDLLKSLDKDVQSRCTAPAAQTAVATPPAP